MYTPRRWQGPVGPPWCVPVLPMGAPGCCSGSVVRCSCSCLPACRAPYRAVFCESCGWRACVAVLSLVVRTVRAVRSVLWCRDVPSSVLRWARCNTSVPAGRGSAWPPCGEPVVPRVLRLGFRMIGIPGSVAAPLRLIDAVSFLRGVRPSYHSRSLYVPKPPRRPRCLTFPEEVCAGPRGARIPGCSPRKVIVWTIVR